MGRSMRLSRTQPGRRQRRNAKVERRRICIMHVPEQSRERGRNASKAVQRGVALDWSVIEAYPPEADTRRRCATTETTSKQHSSIRNTTAIASLEATLLIIALPFSCNNDLLYSHLTDTRAALTRQHCSATANLDRSVRPRRQRRQTSAVTPVQLMPVPTAGISRRDKGGSDGLTGRL